jgi:hypothetical protein
MFEGVPNYPTHRASGRSIDKHKVNIFYTAPTAIRALMRDGDEPVKKHIAQIAAPARHGRRTDQSRSLALVLPVVGEGRCRSSTPGGKPKPAASDHAAARRAPR